MNTQQTIISNRQLNQSEIERLMKKYGADPRNTYQGLSIEVLVQMLQDAFTTGLNRDVIHTQYKES